MCAHKLVVSSTISNLGGVRTQKGSGKSVLVLLLLDPSVVEQMYGLLNL